MRVVLFDDESMEPLTVFTLPVWAHERMRLGERIRFPVINPLRYAAPLDATVVEAVLKTVTVWFEQFIRHGELHWFCFTRDSENAMKLKAVFLPGQQSAIQEREKDAFINGLLLALR